jgi:signal peptidase II
VRGKTVFFIIALCVAMFSLDFGLKLYTHRHIAPMCFSSPLFPYGGIAVFRDWFGIDFSLNYAMNKGAAWGVFAQFQHLLLWVRFLVVLVLMIYLCVTKGSSVRKGALACIVTGAIGNIADFFLYGHVVDMFHFCFWGYSFPIFNVADAVIFCGVALLFLRSFLEKDRKSSSCKAY